MERILGPLLQRAAQQLGGAPELQRALGRVLERAARRALGSEAQAQIDVAAGTLRVLVRRRVVERPASPDEIGLAQARAIDRRAELGDELGCTMALDALAPYLPWALVVPAEQYAPLHALLGDLMWDRQVLPTLPREALDPRKSIASLADTLQRGRFRSWLRPGCDAVELEAHELMLGCMLPRGLRQLLSRIGGMDDAPHAPRLSLGAEGYRLLSPREAQWQHVEWTRRRDEPRRRADGRINPATAWDPDWLPVALGSRVDAPTTLMVVDAHGSAARPGQLLSLSFEEAGWWQLGVDVTELAHVWHTLALYDLLEYVRPGQGDPIVAAKAEAMVEHLLPEHRWVDAR